MFVVVFLACMHALQDRWDVEHIAVQGRSLYEHHSVINYEMNKESSKPNHEATVSYMVSSAWWQ